MHSMMILALSLLACGDKDGDDSGLTGDGGGGDGGSTGGVFEDYINVDQAPAGDLDSCWDGTNWVVQTPVSAYQVDVAAYGTVADFETGDAVPDATLELWWGNDPTAGVADYQVTSDASGEADTTWKTCTPIAYKASTDPALDETVDTYEVNQVEPYTEGVLETEFNSVSSTTYAIIPALLGVSPDSDKGVIAGTAYDCGGEPIEGAQIVITDDEGNIPESLVTKYFVDEFPNRDQPWTSEDGLWVAINVPSGEWNIDMYVFDPKAGAHKLVGRSRAPIFTESILISNVYTGFEDGIRYPDICVE